MYVCVYVYIQLILEPLGDQRHLPPHIQIPNSGLNCSGSIEKNLHISGPSQFTPVLFKDQLGLSLIRFKMLIYFSIPKVFYELLQNLTSVLLFGSSIFMNLIWRFVQLNPFCLLKVKLQNCVGFYNFGVYEKVLFRSVTHYELFITLTKYPLSQDTKLFCLSHLRMYSCVPVLFFHVFHNSFSS